MATGGNTAILVTLCEDLEIGNWNLDPGKEGVDGLRQAEVMPEDPMAILFSGICCSNTGLHLLLDSAEVRVENIGQGTLLSRTFLLEIRVKEGKKLVVRQVPTAGLDVGHSIQGAWDEIFERHVAEKTLVKGLELE